MTRILFVMTVALFAVGCVSSGRVLKEVSEAARQGGGSLKNVCERTGSSGACALAGAKNLGSNPLAIMQSVTSENQTRIVVLLPDPRQPSYFIRRPQGLERVESESWVRDRARTHVDHLEISNLKLHEVYELLVLGPDGELWDRRTFRALDLNLKKPKLLLASCMDDGLVDVADQMWFEAVNQKPDAVLMIGDNVYADKKDGKRFSGDTDHIWNRYAETRSRLAIFRNLELVPVFATWDDHDYGLNDSDRTFAYKDGAREVFYAFFAQKRPGPHFERGPGVASLWSAFGLDFVFLDDRSFRSPNRIELADETHFGVEQEAWLNEFLKKTKRPTILISGDQFFGGYHNFESFEGCHPRNFRKSLEEWKKTKTPILFLSGDRHLSEISRIPAKVLGYTTYEITSSAIHATVFPGNMTRSRNPYHWAGRDGVYNYSLLNIKEVQKDSVQVEVSALSLGRQQLYKKDIKVKR